ncbi:MAG: SufE family protein [Aeromonas sp.]
MLDLAHYTSIGQDPTADTLRAQFAAARSWEAQYRLIINLSKLLPTLPATWQQEPQRIHGCESQAWLLSECDEQGRWHFACDSDARIVRGLIVIILAALNHQTAAQIRAFDLPAYLAELGVDKHLSPSRGNGLRGIVEAILQRIA